MGASWGLFRASRGPLGALWGPLAVSGVLLGRLEDLFGPSWALLDASWAILGPTWAVLGPSWGPLGAILGTSLAALDAKHDAFPYGIGRCFPVGAFLGVLLEPYWGGLEASWAAGGHLRQSWGILGLLFRRLAGLLGRLEAVVGAVGTLLGPSQGPLEPRAPHGGMGQGLPPGIEPRARLGSSAGQTNAPAQWANGQKLRAEHRMGDARHIYRSIFGASCRPLGDLLGAFANITGHIGGR